MTSECLKNYKENGIKVLNANKVEQTQLGAGKTQDLQKQNLGFKVIQFFNVWHVDAHKPLSIFLSHSTVCAEQKLEKR